jgi:alkylhydroperoxidase family enzyme
MKEPAWIEIIPEDRAEGELGELYERWQDRRYGKVDNILRIHSLHPRTLGEHAELYDTTMHGPSGLSLAEREMIALVVSSINRCHY